MRILLLSLAVSCLMLSTDRLSAQTVPPPSDRLLDRVNLKTEWTTAIPIRDQTDGIALVQVVDGNQIFVRTKGGLLVVVDAKTGRTQWSMKFDSIHAPVYPVSVNEKTVAVVNLITLYCIHRYTGLIEFQHELPYVPSSAPVLDRDVVYVTMNGRRVTAYELPESLLMPEQRKAGIGAVGSLANAADLRVANPADEVAKRYPGSSRNVGPLGETFEERRVTLDARQIATGGLGKDQKTPSMSILPTVRPPYRAFDDRGRYIQRSESLSTVQSMRQPYSLRDPTSRQNQRTPSVTSIPPSMASVYEMASLLPQSIKPKARWIIGSTIRLTHAPLTTEFRIWLSGDSPFVQAYLKNDRAEQIFAKLPNIPAAQPVQAEDVGYFPLVDGNLLAIDLTSGGGAVPRVIWRSNVGGAMNREPLVTKDMVYQGGDTSGVAGVDRATGEVVWRTDDSADTVVAVNDDVVYVRDKRGHLRVYDRKRILDSLTKRAVLLGMIDISDFASVGMNDRTDRIYAASETGLLICLRDKSRKYAVPLTVGLPAHQPPPPEQKGSNLEHTPKMP